MPRLELTHDRSAGILDVRYHGDGDLVTASVPFRYGVDGERLERIRWLAEDHDPAAWRADFASDLTTTALEATTAVGTELFTAAFAGEAEAIGRQVSARSAELDIEIRDIGAMPWELLRDPQTGLRLAVHARSFTRVHAGASAIEPPHMCRVLVVIARPGGGQDVPFRSVARHIVDAAFDGGYDFAVDVVRPPTLDRVAEMLRDAAAIGIPYSALHFDGHGVFADGAELGALGVVDPPSGPRRGYLIFEGPRGAEAVSGEEFARLCERHSVTCVILNACRSAHDDASGGRLRGDYASVTEDLLSGGVAGIVAMRYNVRVATAATFMRALYDELFAGRDLVIAATTGRRAIEFELGVDGVAVDRLGWAVPVVHSPAGAAVIIAPRRPPQEVASSGDEFDGRPQERYDPYDREPDTGAHQVDRDDVLLAVDRAFDRSLVVILKAWAGAGKSTVADQFMQWFGNSGAGGLQAFSVRFGVSMTADELMNNLQMSLDMQPTYEITGDGGGAAPLQALAEQIQSKPLLWVWENFDLISLMPPRQRAEILQMLAEFSDRRFRILVLSRRDDRAALGGRVATVELGPLPEEHAVQLAISTAGAAGRTLSVEQARELAAVSEGLPAVIVRRAADPDGPGPGRIATDFRDLLEHLLDPRDRELLNLLGCFHRIVGADVLTAMVVEPGHDIPIGTAVIHEDVLGLLNVAAQLGLLMATGTAAFRIHPILHSLVPVPDEETRGIWAAQQARICNRLGIVYAEGYHHVVDRFALEEPNLLVVWDDALRTDDWQRLIEVLIPLRALYRSTERYADLDRLLATIEPLYQRTADDPSRQEEIEIYRSQLVEQAIRRGGDGSSGDLGQGRDMLARSAARVAELRGKGHAELSEPERLQLRRYAVMIEQQGRLLVVKGDRSAFEFFDLADAIYAELQDGQAGGILGLVVADAQQRFGELDAASGSLDEAVDRINPHDRGTRSAYWQLRGRIEWQRLREAGTASVERVDAVVDAYRHAAAEAPTELSAAQARIWLADVLNISGRSPEVVVSELRIAVQYLEREQFGSSLHKTALLYSARALLSMRKMPEATALLRAVAGLGGDDQVADFTPLVEQLDRLDSTDPGDRVWQVVVVAAATWRNLGLDRPLRRDVLLEMVEAELGHPPDPTRFEAAVGELDDHDDGYEIGVQLGDYLRGLGRIGAAGVEIAVRYATDAELAESCGPVVAELARRFERDGRLDAAETWWALAMRLDPSGTAAEYGLALLRRGVVDRAADVLGRAPGEESNAQVVLDVATELAMRRHPATEVWALRAARLGDFDWLSRLLDVLTENDGELAVLVLRAVAEQGDPSALSLLSRIALAAGEARQAADLAELAADAGHPGAMFDQARALDRTGDRDGAEEWMRRAAGAGHLLAMFMLGGFSLDRDDVDGAKYWWSEATRQGEGNSRTMLGALLADEGAPEAEGLLHASAENGDARAMERLAELARARGDRKEAKEWRRRARSAWKHMGPNLGP